ncbi:ParB/RepB/Spo0J family partition protein [Lichenibacterium ramalinae]|uniref:ParB/RepB/Spo0J family partition protein n=1 Tax=Lichenibacterium ramalinae TaxID=2316527 RepID=A0A4Q2RAE0_9HYPH|nr:ParB/RepB/Spo0J family partition protein [Lichenibacterium ramalinae]RYB04003.1 ParB/RepB/Spo0J family partition protein [Lichenibacterium ramalinae]
MAEEGGRSRLGRGLAALIADSSAQMPTAPAPEARDRRRVRIADVKPNPHNPRRSFLDEDLQDLSNSIREKGIIQPIVVRPAPGRGGDFEIIAGERRWRAAQAAGLADVPVVVVEVDDKEALELAIIENVQRADLNAIEEARGYDRLAREFGYSQTDLARIIGKSRSHVANMLRLLKLPGSVEAMVVDGSISAGHARALLGFADPEPVARRIVAKGLNVREVEKLAQARQKASADAAAPAEAAPAATPRRGVDDRVHESTRALGQRLAAALGLSVAIDAKGAGGEIRIRYETHDELESLCRQLGR